MNRKAPRSTAEFLDILKKEGELKIIDVPLSPHLVIPEIQRRVVAENGPALLFTHVEGSRFQAATNLFGSPKRIALALGGDPIAHMKRLSRFIESLPPTWDAIKSFLPATGRILRSRKSKQRKANVLAGKISSLNELPALTSWPEDGGPFVTLPLVYTQDPETGKGNLGMYRVHIQTERQAGMHIQILRGGGNHYHKAELHNQPLPASVFIGGPPALTLAAVAPLPEDVPEIAFASFLMNKPIRTTENPLFPGHLLASDADFCITGLIPPHKRAPEGPFGDHYGYYSLQHPYPYMDVKAIYHRKDAIYPATVVGRPPQEDHFIAIFLQELFAPLFPIVMKGVEDVFAYEESGVHSLAGAIVKERYHKEAFTACMRILGEGQLSLTKVLFATEAKLNLKEFRQLFIHILERCDFQTDLHVLSNISLDSLDYTGPEINRGSKALFLGLGEKRFELVNSQPDKQTLPDWIFESTLYCPGVLVIRCAPYQADPQVGEKLTALEGLHAYRVVIIHDHPKDCTSSDVDFIWNVFTRFEPAGDIYARKDIRRNHIAYQAPLIIDCRMKPGYPSTLIADKETVAQVDRIWNDIF
ncbi:MAG: 4-hydroxybenzoate decarboxylase [Acidobacteria bacterium]|nr:MAG: 4-hydroxybenzoate decarboxylase [Acidobacteriota bacterium]